MLGKVRMLSLAGAAVMLAGTLGGASSAVAATHSGPAASELGFSASGFGSQVKVGSVVKSGRSALSVLGCTSQVGVTHTNTVASVTAAPLLTTGTIDTSAASADTGTGAASIGSATTQGASLLGGLVSATVIRSVSTTSRDSSTGALSTSPAGTEFLGLIVAGVPVSATPAPNTKLTLPGVGYVILNQQTGHVSKHHANLTVIGLHLVVTLSTPLAPVGTNIIVSDARSGLGGPVSGLLTGLAYGASAHVLAGLIIAGPEFPQALGCLGTNGKTRTNSGVAVSIPGILSSGTVTDTAEGVASANQASAETTSTVQGLNLASGLVTATVIKADVTANGNPPALGDNSTFLGLAVAGFPGITDNVPPNTKLSLAGIGTLWLHKVIKSAHKITVIMVQLDVTVPSNPLGLAPGTQVNVAYASVGIH